MTVIQCPGKPDMLNHVAYITHDTAATVEFYTKLLGMDLVAAVMDDAIPSTGDPVPYFHSFFKMSDGSTIAFFEAPELPAAAAHTHPAYNIFQHIALSVDSTATVDAWADHTNADSLRWLPEITTPILIELGTADPTVLPHMARQMYDAASASRQRDLHYITHAT